MLFRSVYDNVAFGLVLQKMPKKQIKERVTELLAMTGLSGMEKRYPNQLSGGQRQREMCIRDRCVNVMRICHMEVLYMFQKGKNKCIKKP